MNRPAEHALCTNPHWEGRADCEHCHIRSHTLFSHTSNENLQQILMPIDNYSFEPKSVLYSQGEEAHSMFTVRRGVVKLTLQLANGAERVVRVLHPGDAFGLESLIEPVYSHTATTIGHVNLCRIPAAVIRQLIKLQDGLYEDLLKRWQRNLDQADKIIAELSTGPAQSRMSRLLLMDDGDPNSVSSTAFSREDLGEMLGITTETASRIIADFKRRGWLDEKDGNFYLKNKAALQRLSEDM